MLFAIRVQLATSQLIRCGRPAWLVNVSLESGGHVRDIKLAASDG